MSSTSGSTWMATAKPRRMYIPDEYVFTGASMNSSSSAKATISSKRRSTSLRVRPSMIPLIDDVLAPGDLGVEPGPELDQRGDPPVDHQAAAGGLGDAGQQLEERRLAGAVLADDPEGRAAGDLERHAVEGGEGLVGPEVGEEAPVSSALFRVLNWLRWRKRR